MRLLQLIQVGSIQLRIDRSHWFELLVLLLIGDGGAILVGKDGKAVRRQAQCIDGFPHLVDGYVSADDPLLCRFGQGDHQLLGRRIDIRLRGDHSVSGLGLLIPGAGSRIVTTVIGLRIFIAHGSGFVTIVGGE